MKKPQLRSDKLILYKSHSGDICNTTAAEGTAMAVMNSNTLFLAMLLSSLQPTVSFFVITIFLAKAKVINVP